jgi:hypothetical protein
MEEMYKGKTGLWVRSKWLMARGIRNTVILASYVIVGASSAKVWNAIHPFTVYADKEVVVKETIKFEDIPMLVKICKAESGGKQFNSNGDVLRGKVTPSDIGYCQISEVYNNDLARKLGYDIYTEQGNKDFAVYLYFTRGVQPWMASSGVWSK